jgi:hypothetical protein
VISNVDFVIEAAGLSKFSLEQNIGSKQTVALKAN